MTTQDIRSALVVLVPEAEPMVAALRERFDPPASVFAKPIRTKVGYYCKSRSAERFVTLSMKSQMLYAFHCVNDIEAEVDCGLCKRSADR